MIIEKEVVGGKEGKIKHEVVAKEKTNNSTGEERSRERQAGERESGSPKSFKQFPAQGTDNLCHKARDKSPQGSTISPTFNPNFAFY